MHDWVTAHLKDYAGAEVEERRAWRITLRWYFGYCAKKNLGDPSKRENGRLFWREAVEAADREGWQEAQGAASWSGFFQVGDLPAFHEIARNGEAVCTR